MDDKDRDQLHQLEINFKVLDNKVDTQGIQLGDIIRILNDFKNPRPTNWVGICSFGLALTLAVGSFVGMFLTMRLTPIEKDLRTLDNEFKAQSARVQREMEWNYANQGDRQAFTDKTIERMWDRIFSGDPPQFTVKPKP